MPVNAKMAMLAETFRSGHRHFGLATLAIMAIDVRMHPSQIIDALGGNAELAKSLGEKTSNVWRWRERGIPARFWHRVAELAQQKGVAGVSLATVERPLWQRGAA
jgi:hypothetical protein